MQTQPQAAAPVAWEADAETFRFRYVSPAAERLLGFSAAEWLEPGFWVDRLHPDDRERAVADCIAATQACEDHRLRYRLIAADGCAVWVEDEVEVVVEDGRAAALRGVMVDATAPHHDDATAQFLLQHSSDVISILEPTGEVRYVSPAVERILGFRQEDLVGANGFDYVHPDDRGKARTEVLNALATPGFTGPVELRLRHRDGAYRVLESIARTTAGGLVLVTSRDITLQRRETEAQKMEAIGRLAGSIAHDFNNILLVIRSLAELLALDVTGQEALARTNELILASERGSLLTRQLLSFSRRHLTQHDRCDVDATVGRFVAMVAGVLRTSGIDLRATVEPGLPAALIGAGDLDQVLLNLVLNARDAMPDGGLVEIAADRAADMIRVRVSDQGNGMDEATRARIFEPYFTTKDEGSGTGLGLATAFAIVTQRGGEIDVESTLDVGTTFELSIPVAPRAHVLVIDDDPVVRAVLARALAVEGYAVETVDGGAAARAAIAEAPYDLVVADILLGEGRSTDLVRGLRDAQPHLRVIVMSGRGVHPHERAQADAVLMKPFSLDELQETVAALLTGR